MSAIILNTNHNETSLWEGAWHWLCLIVFYALHPSQLYTLCCGTPQERQSRREWNRQWAAARKMDRLAARLRKQGTVRGESFYGLVFSNQDLRGVKFERCIFFGCKFYTTDLSSTQWEQCEFEGCDLTGTRCEVSLWIKCHFRRCDLSYAKFNAANLADVCFYFSQCYSMHFRGASLKRVTAPESQTQDTDMKGATLLSVGHFDAEKG
jgi:uncharacterized protein YjbI with pentapeptide repeats